MEDNRPTKKPRMIPPDGFQVATLSTSKPQRRIAELPRFIGLEASSKQSNSAASSSSGAKMMERPIFIFPTKSPDRKPTAMKPPALAHPTAGRPSTKHSFTTTKMKVLKLPVLDAASVAGLSSARSDLRPITAAALRPVKPDPSSSTSSRTTVSSMLNRTLIIPPRLGTPASSSLKPLPPPPPLANRKAGPSKPATKSIMETRIAKAIDIRTEGGAAELLSIFLRQHGTGYVDPYDRELNRGVEQSPEKRSKARNAKYVRGGLAEAASRQLAALRTNQTLWETDFARMQKKGQFAKPDVHIRIHSVLAASPVHNSKSAHSPPVVLVRGTIVASDSLEIRRGDVIALFRLGEAYFAPGKRVLDLTEGREVHAWRPWTHIARSEDEDEGVGTVWCFSRFHVFESKKRRLEPFPMIPSQ